MRATEFVAEKIIQETKCPHCGGIAVSDSMLAEKQDACYHKVKSRYKIWPSAYASGALVQCRKKGAANWGNKAKKESAGEEPRKPRTAKALIYQTDMYGAKGYFAKCVEPDCDWKSRAYDRIQQAQAAAKKHGQQHFSKHVDENVTVTELAGYRADKKYQDLGSYKRYDVYVSRKKFNDLYFIAVAENPRTLEAKFKAKGDTPKEALANLQSAIDKEIETAPKVSGQATLDFNVDFVREVLEGDSGTFYAKIVPGPKLVLAGSDMQEYPDIMRDEGFKPSTIRTYKGGEGTTKLPAVPLSSKAAAAANVIANGRYVLGPETQDKDGNRVFALEFDSVVSAANEKMRLKTPAVTVGTLRSQSLNEVDLNEGLKEKAAAIVMSLGLLGPMASQNANAFDLGDVARALPMVVGVVNQNRGLDNRDVLRRVVTQEINQYRAEERQFDRWFAHQLQDPRDRDAFRMAAQEKEFWQARAMNMRSGSDAAKAAAAVTYYQAVRDNLAEKYGITVPR